MIGTHQTVSVMALDCVEMMRQLPDDSIDSVVTDPPYGLSAPPDISVVLGAWMRGEEHAAKGGGFMGAKWDRFVPGPRVWREVLRVLKPGGHAVVFAGTRTVDLMGVSCRLAGFEVRDTGRWVYYNGFPKGADIGKGIATPEAEQWEGWKTGLKPSGEPWLLLRKPLRERTIVRQVLATGTGGINIDGCRYPHGDRAWVGPQNGWNDRVSNKSGGGRIIPMPGMSAEHKSGRYPANLYACKKASKKERERGCDALPLNGIEAMVNREPGSPGTMVPSAGAGRSGGGRRNKHPTVKPVELMRWLCRLVTPPGGTVLDPFIGSGTTGIAAHLEGFSVIGADSMAEFAELANSRISHAVSHPEQWADTQPGSRIARKP